VKSKDLFLDLMTEREAAFHNFRCFEAQARRAGLDLANDPEVSRLMAEVSPQNTALEALLADAQDEVESQLGRMHNARNVARAYHSGTQAPARFIKQS